MLAVALEATLEREDAKSLRREMCPGSGDCTTSLYLQVCLPPESRRC